MPGVVAVGVPLGGLTQAQAVAKITEAAKAITPPQLSIQANTQTLQLAASELGWQPDVAATVASALKVGHQGSLVSRFAERYRAWKGQISLPLIPHVDQAALENKLEAIAAGLKRLPVNAKIEFDNGQFVVRPDQAGIEFDPTKALQAFSQNPAETTLVLEPTALPAKVQAASLQPVVEKANPLVRPVLLKYSLPPTSLPEGNILTSPPKQRLLKSDEVAELLVLKDDVTLDTKAVARIVGRMSLFDLDAVDARYVLQPGNQLVTRPQRDGWKLNQQAAQNLLETELMQPGVGEIVLPVLPKIARIRSASLPKVDQLVLLSEGITYYGGSIPERAANVAVAARNLDGYVVPAGGVFNYNQAVGDISPENGFKEALVISNGRTIKGVGGGVCQMSTTAFRALYKAGLPVIERNQHAYRVHWYDPIVGFDAAVYQPYLNLRMQNDTPGPLVVRASAGKGVAVVRVYGLPTGRKVNISNPVIWDRRPSPPTQYIVNPAFRGRQSKQVDWAEEGMKTRIFRTVTEADGMVRRDVTYSNFKPWRAVYEVAPGSPLLYKNNVRSSGRQ
jgi:vancomycin resistance protein YoaR